MSREVLGTLPDAAAGSVPDVSPSGGTATHPPGSLGSGRGPGPRPGPGPGRTPPNPPPPGHTPPTRTPPARTPWQRRTTVLAAAATLGITIGWLADTAWQTAQSADARLRTAGLSSVVVDAQHTGDAPTRMTADLTVRLDNLGLAPVQLIGSEVTYDAVAVVAIEPPRQTVPVDASRTVVLRVAIGCRSPRPLRLPPLQGRTPDGALLSLPTDGAGQALADLCAAGAGADHVIRQVGVSGDGTQLKVAMTADSGRTTEVHQIRAGGVRLEARPLPATVDGTVRTFWLQRPTECSPLWQRSGLPEVIHLDVDIGADVTVAVPLGYALAGWLLDGPCRGSPR